MNPPPKLPEGAVLLSLKRTPSRSFEGWMFDPERSEVGWKWSDYWAGDDWETCLYAAPADSEVARLNAPEPVTGGFHCITCGEATRGDGTPCGKCNGMDMNGQPWAAPPPAGAKGELSGNSGELETRHIDTLVHETFNSPLGDSGDYEGHSVIRTETGGVWYADTVDPDDDHCAEHAEIVRRVNAFPAIERELAEAKREAGRWKHAQQETQKFIDRANSLLSSGQLAMLKMSADLDSAGKRNSGLAAALRTAIPCLDTDKDLSDEWIANGCHPSIQKRRLALRVAESALKPTPSSEQETVREGKP